MLYCDDCRLKHSWPVSTERLVGGCEICGQFAARYKGVMVAANAPAAPLLAERERAVLECLIEVWDDHNNLLPGRLSYQDVFDFCDKFGISRPPHLLAFLERCDRGPKHGTP